MRTVEREFTALQRPGRYTIAQLTGVQAGLAALERRVEEAAELYREAIEQFDELRLGFVAALTRVDAVRALGLASPDLLGYAAQARSAFDRLGATACLDLLARVEAEVAVAGADPDARADARRTEATRA
jgi:hypothetical protein